jgi:hypothetical protein
LPGGSNTLNPSAIAAYQQQQQALADSFATLIAKGVTLQQIEAWHQLNASAIAAQQQQAAAMAAAADSAVMSTVGQPNIPANASQALKDFLTEQAALANAHAQTHNQFLQQAAGSGQGLTGSQVAQMELENMQAFQQAHDGDLQLQVQRAQSLANASPQVAVELPVAPIIPSNASPQLSAFLRAKYQLVLSQAQVLNQNATAAPSVQAAALQQWQQQNASSIAQLHQLEQNLVSQNQSSQN